MLRLFPVPARHKHHEYFRHFFLYDPWMTAKIKFGTSGWRAIIADEFTFSNVRLTAEAIGRYVKTQNASPTILVGYDTRFASEDFGRAAADVLTSQGIRVKLCSRAVPTPAVALTIMKQNLDGAINITASHNPGEYSGIKFSGSDGAPALPDVTGAIESGIEQLQQSNWLFAPGSARAELITMVGISLGNTDISSCLAGDVSGPASVPDGQISIDELIRAVNNAQAGCTTG